MSEHTLDLFVDDNEAPDIPPRSILYHCPLIDERTPRQESLLSYVHRLARAHNLRVMDLLVHVVLPKTGVSVERGRFKFSHEYARTVNGYGKYSTAVSAALRELTGVKSLESATFLPWQSLFDGKGAGLLHQTRNWCPDCLAEAEERGEALNFPLIWACLSVTHCRTHFCELQSTCMRCGAKQRPICDSAHYGRCVACGTSLAWRSSLFQASRLSLRQDFMVGAVGEMIALGNRAGEVAQPEILGRGLQQVADATHGGSLCRLARAIRLAPKSLRDWTCGAKRPRFDSFLELCYRLGIKPLDLLGDEDVVCVPRLRSGALPLTRPKFKLSPEQLRDVETEMWRNFNSEDAPIRLVDLASKHNTSVGHLRYQLPKATAALMYRYRMIRKMSTEARLEDRLRRARVSVQPRHLHP